MEVKPASLLQKEIWEIKAKAMELAQDLTRSTFIQCQSTQNRKNAIQL